VDKNESVRNKIIILYILSRIPGITVGELTAIALDTCYMNYFAFAAAYDELYSSHFLTRALRKGERSLDSDGNPVLRCDITGIGIETLNRLVHLIPENVHTFLNKVFADWEKSIKKNAEVRAFHEPDPYGGFLVVLLLSDGTRDLIHLKLSVPSKEIAIATCKHWKENTQSHYLAILSLLSTTETDE
jgi:hypothetical protein